MNVDLLVYPQIQYAGFLTQADLYSVMLHAKAFIMPSWNESLSIVTLEAMAFNVPVLASERSATVAGHIRKSGGGILYKETNSLNDSPLDFILSIFKENNDTISALPDFNEALNNILSDDQFSENAGKNGRNYIENNYSLPVIKTKLLHLLKPY
jgi:glycosyltransferase involved in cell wall biosynthesis